MSVDQYSPKVVLHDQFYNLAACWCCCIISLLLLYRIFPRAKTYSSLEGDSLGEDIEIQFGSQNSRLFVIDGTTLFCTLLGTNYLSFQRFFMINHSDSNFYWKTWQWSKERRRQQKSKTKFSNQGWDNIASGILIDQAWEAIIDKMKRLKNCLKTK